MNKPKEGKQFDIAIWLSYRAQNSIFIRQEVINELKRRIKLEEKIIKRMMQ